MLAQKHCISTKRWKAWNTGKYMMKAAQAKQNCNYGAENGNGLYTIGIDKGGDRIYTTNTWNDTFSYTFDESGEYSAYITAYGGGTLSDSNRVYFTVKKPIPVIKTVVTVKRRVDKRILGFAEHFFRNLLYSVKIRMIHKIELL